MQISREEIHSVILEYLDLVARGKRSDEENLNAMEIVLDQLALARRFVAYNFDEADYPDAPRKNYAELRELATKRFPECGFYNFASPITDQIGGAEILIGDAFDDIADIAKDLHEVTWRWEHNSPDDALFHFEILYDGHWGEHLRNLQIYLHYFKNRL
jgi:hypothetical protein